MSFIYSSQLEDRYAVAAETRNNLVAASQNIQGAQRYLSNIQFPYCAPPEVDTLNKVCSKLHGFTTKLYALIDKLIGKNW